jgi:hypothetical protein
VVLDRFVEDEVEQLVVALEDALDCFVLFFGFFCGKRRRREEEVSARC